MSNIKGIFYQMPWGMLEKSKGVYDFSRLDAALAKAKAKGKYLVLYFFDRTYWTGCGSNFVPSYVAKEGSATNSKVCYAKIWETATMDHEIRVLQQVARRYQGDPYFLGILQAETSINPPTLVNNHSLHITLYGQLKRAAAAVHSAAPALLFGQEINWPAYGNISHFYGIADAFQAMGGGGALSWPNSAPSKQYSWPWYQVARDRRSKLVIMPRAETGYFPGTPGSQAEADQIYNMLVNDIGAHMVVWDRWAPIGGANYLTNVVIPTVNKYKGAVKNTTCPF
jgi:hypothetical protein